MNDSNTVRAGQFKKGDDPRRHKGGQISKAVLAFNKTLRELIIFEGERKHTDADGKVTLKKVEWMVKVLWNAALKGEHWAMEFIAERTEGKITQPVGLSGSFDHALTIKVVQVEDKNGNSNGNIAQ